VVSSVKGKISSSFINLKNSFELNIETPTDAIVGIPLRNYSEISVNGHVVWKNGKYSKNNEVTEYKSELSNNILFKVKRGTWKFESSINK
jgi:hypothetical protein